MKVILIGLLFALLMPSGSAHYLPGQGRWLSRDPIEEDGGINLYVFNRSDGINHQDLLGLTWKIERKGRERAHAMPESGDTVSDLARIIGFDDKDFHKWLKVVGPSRMPSSAMEPISSCSQFTISNTVFIEFGKMFKTLDRFGPIPAWRLNLTDLAQSYRADGFNVVLTDPSSPDAARRHLQSPNIHGFAYAGHGGGNAGRDVGLLVFQGGEGNTSLDGRRFTKFGINFLYAYACSSANRNPNNQRMQRALGYALSPWERNVAARGVFKGIWGEVNGYQTWTHIIETAGTNR